MRNVIIAAFAALTLSFSGFKYNVDPKLEDFYLDTIEDLKEYDFTFPDKKGVHIAFVKKNPKQHKYGVAWALQSEDYSMIRIQRKNWGMTDYWQRRWVMTHEMLHTFGYEHSNDTNSLMYWDVPERVTPQDYYNALEVALKEK